MPDNPPEKAFRDSIRRRHLAYSTEQSYLTWLRRYEDFLRHECPAGDSTAKVAAFLTSMARADLSATSQNQALQALLMFYREVRQCELGRVDALRARRPQRLRYVPTRDEVARLLAQVRDLGGYPTRLIVQMLYGCGMRVNEPLNLRLKDLDLDGARMIVREAKGNKDRVVRIPFCLIEPLRKQIAVASAMWERDVESGLPVALPGHLAQKYPAYQYARGWYWLFPAHAPCKHPRTGETVRWRTLDCNVQRAVFKAVRSCGIQNPVTPHCLRHAFATHALEDGSNIRNVQAAMGHNSIETTMIYLSPDSLHVASPLDTLYSGAPVSRSA